MYTHPSTKVCNYSYTHPSSKQCSGGDCSTLSGYSYSQIIANASANKSASTIVSKSYTFNNFSSTSAVDIITLSAAEFSSKLFPYSLLVMEQSINVTSSDINSGGRLDIILYNISGGNSCNIASVYGTASQPVYNKALYRTSLNKFSTSITTSGSGVCDFDIGDTVYVTAYMRYSGDTVSAIYSIKFYAL